MNSDQFEHNMQQKDLASTMTPGGLFIGLRAFLFPVVLSPEE